MPRRAEGVGLGQSERCESWQGEAHSGKHLHLHLRLRLEVGRRLEHLQEALAVALQWQQKLKKLHPWERSSCRNGRIKRAPGRWWYGSG